MLVHGFREGILSEEKLQQAATSVPDGLLTDEVMSRIFKQGWLQLHPDKHRGDSPLAASKRAAAWRDFQKRKELLLHTTKHDSPQRIKETREAFHAETRAAAVFQAFFEGMYFKEGALHA